MQRIAANIRALRRYISKSKDRKALENTDTLLSVALGEVERALAMERNDGRGDAVGGECTERRVDRRPTDE
jgi:hypothetical protein